MPHSNYFRETFLNPEDVGGRYSALTYVGIVPAALLWLDLDPLLEDARINALCLGPGFGLGAATPQGQTGQAVSAQCIDEGAGLGRLRRIHLVPQHPETDGKYHIPVPVDQPGKRFPVA